MIREFVRIFENDVFVVDYDKYNNQYRVSYFEDYHFKEECYFDAYEEKEVDNNNVVYSVKRSEKYTDEWNGFQFVSPTYLDGHFEPFRYSLVKWENHEPFEVTDLDTGKNRISTRSCFTIATLIWDPKEPGFEFESCGLRYLEHRVDGLEKFILDFSNKKEEELLKN